MIAKPHYEVTKLDVARDAPFAKDWQDELGGGIAEQLKEFAELEDERKQLTWAIRVGDQTVGIVWLRLEDTQDIQAPSMYILIGNTAHRTKGIGSAVIKDTIRYAYCNLPYEKLYSRYLTSNSTAEGLLRKLGFERDGDAYDDEEGNAWQNVKITL